MIVSFCYLLTAAKDLKCSYLGKGFSFYCFTSFHQFFQEHIPQNMGNITLSSVVTDEISTSVIIWFCRNSGVILGFFLIKAISTGISSPTHVFNLPSNSIEGFNALPSVLNGIKFNCVE